MKVAKVLYAANSPLQDSKRIRCGGRDLKVSSQLGVVHSGGDFVGYTTLQKTKELNVDRVQVGHVFYEIYPIKSYYYSDVKYCICVDDVANKWLIVLAKGATCPPSEATENSMHHLRNKKASKVGVILLAVGCTSLALLLNSAGKREITESTQETNSHNTQVVIGHGGSKTYTYGSVTVQSTEKTSEDILNSEIKESKPDADKEKQGFSNKSVDAAGDVTESKLAAKEPESAKESESETKADTEAQKNTEAKKNTEAPYSSIADTVLVPAPEQEPNTEEELIESYGTTIGDITISDNKSSCVFSNPCDEDVQMTFSKGKKDFLQFTVKKGSKRTQDLSTVFTKTTKVSVKFEYLNDSGKVIKTIESDIVVYVL